MENYRPISVLYQQLYNYFEKNKLLSRRQFGFRKVSSTLHTVTFFSDAINKNMDKGLMIGTVFIDLRKVFDTLDHARLLSKLSIYGIKDRELSWFSVYLFDRKQFVKYYGQSSEIQPITCGVPQGSILGQLMFTLLLNDIATNLQLCDMILYADDILMFHAGKTSIELGVP